MNRPASPRSRAGHLAKVLVATLALALAGVPRGAQAIGEHRWGKYSIEATGSERLTGAFLHFPDVPQIYPEGDDGLAASVTRLLLSGELGARLGYEANIYLDLTRSPSSALAGGALATVASFASPYRNRYLHWDLWESGAMHGQLGLDRLVLNLSLEPLRISAGRFPINYSVTQLFTPNDFFAPFSAAAINKIYKPGVDALRVNLSLGMLSSVELVAVIGSDPDGVPGWSETALLARASTVKWEVQWALLAGKLAGRWTVGASFQGEAGPFGVRGEGHVGFPDGDGDGRLDNRDRDATVSREIYARAALGVDHKFEWRNAMVAFEAAYLSDGALRAPLYLERLPKIFLDDVPYLARLYMGLSAGGEILPILRLNTMVLLNAQDFSGLAALFLSHSAADEVELVAGLLVPWGERPAPVPAVGLGMPVLESEFGLVPLMVFLETRVYF